MLTKYSQICGEEKIETVMRYMSMTGIECIFSFLCVFLGGSLDWKVDSFQSDV